MATAGFALGALGGVGVWLAIGGLSAGGERPLTRRLAPYLAGTSADPNYRVQRTRSVLSLISSGVTSFDSLVGGGRASRRRLAAMDNASLAEFRAAQVLWAGIGAGVGLLLLTVRVITAIGLPPLSLAGLVVVGAGGGALARSYALTRSLNRRDAVVVAQLPAAAELMALAVGAGESPLAALERASTGHGGPLAADITSVLSATRAGAALPLALAALSERTTVPALARFADGLVISLQRGTPLADLLRAQAQDVREDARRQLMELGGRREVAMMAPVVFLILPVTLVIALYPALVTLTSLTH